MNYQHQIVPPTEAPTTQELQLRDYLRPIVDRRWLILVTVVLATVATYAYYASQSSVYEATTKIFVGAPASTPLDQAAVPVSDRTIQNQATLLKSRKVAETVATRLGRRGDATGLASSVNASPSSGSDFVLISARRPNAKEAADVANAFAKAFVQNRSKEQRVEINKALQETTAQRDKLTPTPKNNAERADLGETIRRLKLTLAVPSGSASQVDAALVPGGRVAPQPGRNALFAFVLSLVAGIGLAFGLERFDRRLRRPEDLAPVYGLPILATLPHSTEVAFNLNSEQALSPVFTEAFRQLRTNIQLEALDQPFKRILVTSAISGEGKSTVVRNLAIAFREWGLRVAVVDADLRRPDLARLFDEESEHGLTDVLSGTQRLRDALVAVPVHATGGGTLPQNEAVSTAAGNGGPVDGTQSKVISLLAAGALPANPQAVLATEQARLLLEELEAEHDIVLIDSAPLLIVSDAVALAPDADAVIVVSRLGLSTRDSAQSISEYLGRIPGAHPIGVVVNDLSTFEVGARGYGYGYGYAKERR